MSSWGFAHLNENCRNKIEYQPKIIVGRGAKKKEKRSMNRRRQLPVLVQATLLSGCVVVFFLVFFLSCTQSKLCILDWSGVGWGFFSSLISLLNWIKKATVINAQATGRGEGRTAGARVLVLFTGCCLNQMQNLVCFTCDNGYPEPKPDPDRGLPCRGPPQAPCNVSYLGKILATTQKKRRDWQLENNSQKNTHTHTHEKK